MVSQGKPSGLTCMIESETDKVLVIGCAFKTLKIGPPDFDFKHSLAALEFFALRICRLLLTDYPHEHIKPVASKASCFRVSASRCAEETRDDFG